MANLDAPNGLSPIYRLGGGPIPSRAYEAGVTTAIFAGDIVKMKTSGRIITEVTTTIAVDAIGVAVNYVAAGTTPAVTVWVYDDPFTVFRAQSDGTTDPSNATADSFIGNCGIAVLSTGNTTTGRSKHEIDYETIQTTAPITSHGLKILGWYKAANNDRSLAHADALVMVKNLWNLEAGFAE